MTPNQLTFLVSKIKDVMTGNIGPEYLTSDKLFDLKLTEKQYKYALALCYNKKVKELTEFLHTNILV